MVAGIVVMPLSRAKVDKINNRDPVSINALAGFRSLDAVVVDASSFIYMKKCGFLEETAQTLVLHTTSEVIEETGFSDLPVELHEEPARAFTTDLRLIQLAQYLDLPIISEDKELLLNAGRRGMEYYNALMVLNFLLFKKAVDSERFNRLRSILLSVARYSKAVTAYGEAVTRQVIAATL